MKGRVEIYQGYIKDGKATVDEVPIHVDHNLIVDGAKEHIVDFLTRIPAPSGLLDASNPASGNINHSYDVSNFGIRAVSFSPNSQAFQRTSALAAASGFVFNPTTSGVSWSSLDPLTSRWTYLPDISNFDFSATNAGFSGGTFTNTVLKNPSFSSVTNHLRDGGFTQHYMNKNLSGVHLNEALELYELSQWDIQSFLRYINNDFVYHDSVYAGSVAVGTFKDSSAMSGVCNDGFAASGDNFVFMRSFDRSEDSSGVAGVSTTFSYVPEGVRLGNHSDTTSRHMIAELGFMFSAITGGTYSQLGIRLKNVSKGTEYSFSATKEGNIRNTWGMLGDPLYCNASSGNFQRVSHFVNIPFDYYGDELKLDIFALSTDRTGTSPTKVYVWDAQVNSVDSWEYGHVFSGDNVSRYWTASDTGAPVSSSEGLYLQTKNNDVKLAMFEREASSITYISQMFNMKPLKKYSAFLHGDYSGPAGDTVVPQFLEVGVRKDDGQTSVRGDWNFLSTSSFVLLESRLGSNNVVSSPLLSVERMGGNLEIRDVVAAKVKPSDLCIEVRETDTHLTGHLILPRASTTHFTLSGQVLKTLDTVPGKTFGTPEFTLVTRTVSTQGHRLMYNQGTGRFDLPISSDELTSTSSIPQAARLNTSSFNAEDSEYADFAFRNINPRSLDGVVPLTTDEQSGLEGWYVSLMVYNSGEDAGFFKKLSLYGEPPSSENDPTEYFKWNASSIDDCWQTQPSNASGEYFMSGMSIMPYYGTLAPSAYSPQQLSWSPLEGMFNASGSVHREGTEYQFIIGACNNYQGSPSTCYRISCAGLVDTATVACTEEISGDILTSESYLGSPKFDILNQINIQYDNKRFPSDSFDKSLHPGVGFLTPNFGNLSALQDARRSLVIANRRNLIGSTQTLPKVSVNYTTTLEDINVNFGSPYSVMEEGLGFSFKVQQLVSGTNAYPNGRPSTLWSLEALLDSGEVIQYTASTGKWETSSVQNAFVSRVNRGASTYAPYYKTMLSPVITLNDSRFTPTTKLAFNIVCDSFVANDVTFIKDWEFFRTSQTKGQGIGQFPTPVDTVLQTQYYADETIGELGQFTNNIQFNSVLSGTTYDRALGNGGWAPSKLLVDLQISGVQVNGWTNKYGVLNSDGFLYPSPTNSPVYNNFYGDGFISGASANGNTSSVYFVYDISSHDMRILDVQGGIAAMGLWTFDVDATFKKMVEYNHNVSAIYDYTPFPLAESLYKLTDPTRNPVFKLFAKKVFREPIAFDPRDNHFTRFVWHIRML